MPTDRSEARTLRLPDWDEETADLNEKLDGVTYTDKYWYVSFSFENESKTCLSFTYSEFIVPEDETPDEFPHDEFDGALESLSSIPEEIPEFVEDEGYEVSGFRTDVDDALEPENWLYDGECPNCGDVLCIERVNDPDLCYECGGEVSSP